MDAHKRSARLPRNRPTMLVVGLLSIAAAVCVSVLSDASKTTTMVCAVTACVVVGAILLIRESLRWKNAQLYFSNYQQEAALWRNKWMVRDAEARQTMTALSQMLEGLIMVSTDGVILLLNESARRLLAVSGFDDLLGRRFAEIVRVPEINRAIATVLETHDKQVVSVEIVDDSIVRPLSVQVNRITQHENERVLLMIRDETESRRVDEMRREFIANVSHELKTPLAAIKGYAETVELACEDDPKAAAHFMTQINTQCLRLERLVSDMMQLARAQAGSQFMNFGEVSLHLVIAEALKSCQPLATAKSINLTVDDIDVQAIVLADNEALLTIANNLIGNAIRYTPSGGNVRVSCRRDADAWAFVVADDGIGIPVSDQDRIFERFYRVDKARESADGGTGIGLSIVKHLALSLGGQVGVTSLPNQGATFEVRLPAVATENAAADALITGIAAP